jgi:Mor family transcriptional regulator
LTQQGWGGMGRRVRDIVDGVLFETADVDKFLGSIRAAGLEIVWQGELAALDAELKDRDDLLAKLLDDYGRLERQLKDSIRRSIARDQAASLVAANKVESAELLPKSRSHPDWHRNLEIYRKVCEGSSYETVAALYRLSPGRVRQICLRVASRLRRELNPEGEPTSLAERV